MNAQGAAGYYDQLAAVYDSATEGRWFPNTVIEPHLRDLLDGSETVLDIGTGTGQSLAAIIEGNLAKDIYGIDISEKMLAYCRTKYPSVHTFLGDLLSFSKQSTILFDLVLCSGAFEFVHDPQTFLSLVSLVLRPGGYFLLTFEPFIAFHDMQGTESSEVLPGDAASQAEISASAFHSYRHGVLEVMQWLQESSFDIVNQQEFVAYRKRGVDVIYHLVIAQRD